MSGYYMNNDTGAAYNEASNVVGRMSVEELTKIVNSDEELTRMVRNLSEVCLVFFRWSFGQVKFLLGPTVRSNEKKSWR